MAGGRSPPLPAKLGRVKRLAEDYQRTGTRHLVMFCAPQAGWRHLDVTARRTQRDVAPLMQWWVDQRSPAAAVSRVVLDKLKTPTGASLSEAFAPQEASSILRQRAFHDTPTRARWVTMAVFAWSIVLRPCLGRRILAESTLQRDITAYDDGRHEPHATIDEQLTYQEARVKRHRLYPSIST